MTATTTTNIEGTTLTALVQKPLVERQAPAKGKPKAAQPKAKTKAKATGKAKTTKGKAAQPKAKAQPTSAKDITEGHTIEVLVSENPHKANSKVGAMMALLLQHDGKPVADFEKAFAESPVASTYRARHERRMAVKREYVKVHPPKA